MPAYSTCVSQPSATKQCFLERIDGKENDTKVVWLANKPCQASASLTLFVTTCGFMLIESRCALIYSPDAVSLGDSTAPKEDTLVDH